MLVIAALVGLAYWGHQTGWRIPRFSELTGRALGPQAAWCEEHNRAESQCFLCDPSRADKFAKLYEAKFGEAPPKWTQ